MENGMIVAFFSAKSITMEESEKNLVDGLEHLVTIARDGEKGYEKAAENAKDEDLRALFQRYSQQRSGYVKELQTLIATLGGDPDQSSGIAGALHRTWIDIKEGLSGHDRHALLSSCEQGEDSAKEAYTNFFGDNFEYKGGSTTSPYTVTGGTNSTYESTGMDTGNGSSTSSEGYSNMGSGDRSVDGNLSEENVRGPGQSHSTTMSDMDMDSGISGTTGNANTSLSDHETPGSGNFSSNQGSGLRNSEIDSRVYSMVKKQLEGIEQAHNTIKAMRDNNA